MCPPMTLMSSLPTASRLTRGPTPYLAGLPGHTSIQQKAHIHKTYWPHRNHDGTNPKDGLQHKRPTYRTQVLALACTTSTVTRSRALRVRYLTNPMLVDTETPYNPGYLGTFASEEDRGPYLVDRQGPAQLEWHLKPGTGLSLRCLGGNDPGSPTWLNLGIWLKYIGMHSMI